MKPEEIKLLQQNLSKFSPTEQAEILELIDALEAKTAQERAQEDLISFCKYMEPDYKVGAHHRKLAAMLMQVTDGKKDRISVNIPPRHGKSHLVSTYFPAWFLGRYPGKKVLMVSHTTDLAVDFGRKVRNIIASPKFQEVFPDTKLAIDSKSAGRWNTTKGGEYFACGVGSALAGRGADLLLVDDPHNEQDIINGNLDVFDKAYEWFTFGARTRLMPGGRVAIVQCMTGDTPVLMADGVEKPLRDVCVGDEVASFKDGRLVSRKVLNWAAQGVDDIFTIKTTSHIVRANERHPFLVQTPCGELKWTRLKNLKPGDFLVSLKGVGTPDGQKLNPQNAEPVSQKIRTTDGTPQPHIGSSGTGGSMQEKHAALWGVPHLLRPVVSVIATMGNGLGLRVGTVEARGLHARRTLSTGMGSLLNSMIRCFAPRGAYVPSVNNPPQRVTPERTGVTSCALTTAMIQGQLGDYSVTTVISPLDTLRVDQPPSLSLSISDFTVEQIVDITTLGREEVFDIQVEETENFIANGIVSHNTRWHQDDLTGRLVADSRTKPDADQYEVVEFPAILEIDQPDGGTVEKALWPEFFPLEALYRTKASMPLFQWNAQYQQNPTSEEASLIKREWWRRWTKEDPPKCEFVIMSLDSAAETHNRADYTALTTWGVFFNHETDMYNIILLDSIRDRFEFPELKKLCMDKYREIDPDAFIVEKKSSGVAVYQEMRRMGLPVSEYTPHRGTGDKTARLNAISDIVASGVCWVPNTMWADQLVEEIAGFPFVSHDDLVDSTIMAMMRFRQGGFIRLPTDEKDDIPLYRRKSGGYY